MRRIARTALRECLVLCVGLAVAWLLRLIFDDGRPMPNQMPANPLLALFGSIGLCLVRAALVGERQSEVSNLRWTLYQIVIALALILLLVFEIGAGLFIGARGIPTVAWAILAGLGLGYVFFFCVAEGILPARVSASVNPRVSPLRRSR